MWHTGNRVRVYRVGGGSVRVVEDGEDRCDYDADIVPGCCIRVLPRGWQGFRSGGFWIGICGVGSDDFVCTPGGGDSDGAQCAYKWAGGGLGSYREMTFGDRVPGVHLLFNASVPFSFPFYFILFSFIFGIGICALASH